MKKHKVKKQDFQLSSIAPTLDHLIICHTAPIVIAVYLSQWFLNLLPNQAGLPNSQPLFGLLKKIQEPLAHG
jgi:hypothetical protein